MMDGYIRLYRQILENPVLDSNESFTIFVRCMLLKAAYKPTRVMFRGRVIHLSAGQLLFSIRDLAGDRKISKDKAHRAIKALERHKIIETDSETGTLRVTICNWPTYQSPVLLDATDDETNLRQSRDSLATQNNEVKKERKEESSLRSDSSPRDLANAAFKVWIEELGDVLPTPRKLEGDRRAKLTALLKKRMGNDLDQWREYCRVVRSNPWNLGENARGWRADFDYTVSDIKARKILERGRAAANGANGHGKPSSRGREHISDLVRDLADDQQERSIEADCEVVAIDETHQRAGGSQEGDLFCVDRPSDEIPDWFDRESSEQADQDRVMVASNRRL